MIAVQNVPREETGSYGIIQGDPDGERLHAHERDRREAAPRRRALDAGRGRSLHPRAAHHSASGAGAARRGRRDPAHRRDRLAAAGRDRARLPVRGHALRLRLQARLPGGQRDVRAQAPGDRRRSSLSSSPIWAATPMPDAMDRDRAWEILRRCGRWSAREGGGAARRLRRLAEEIAARAGRALSAGAERDGRQRRVQRAAAAAAAVSRWSSTTCTRPATTALRAAGR